MDRIFFYDPARLRLGAGRFQGADPRKLQTQLSLFGRSIDGMPPLWVLETIDGEYVIMNGITRATRVARFSPGTQVPIVVIQQVKIRGAALPMISDRLP
jgi:hypothetical protein